MDIAQIEPSILGLILAFIIAALFAVVFYWATKDASVEYDRVKSSSAEVRRSPVRRASSGHSQQAKRSKKTPKKKINGDVKKAFNAKEPERDSDEKSLDVQIEKKVDVNEAVTKEEEAEEMESLEEEDTPESNDVPSSVAVTDGGNEESQKADAAAESLSEVLPNKVTEELLRDWMLNMTDPLLSWQTIKRRCVLVESVCQRVKQLEKMLEMEKRVMADRDRRLTERWDEVRRLFKSKIDMCSAFLANEKELFRLRELVETLTVKVKRANSTNQTLRKENSDCTARLQQAMMKQRQDSQEKISLESRCLQLEKDLQMRYEDKMHWVNELHLCEAKLTMADNRRRELEMLLERVRQKLQNDAVEKDALHQRLCDLHVLLPSSRVDKDGSEWKLIKQGVQLLVDSLNLREAEVTSLKQRLKSANEIAYSKLASLRSNTSVATQKDASWDDQSEMPTTVPPASLNGPPEEEGSNRSGEIDCRVENGANVAPADPDNDLENFSSASTSNTARVIRTPTALEPRQAMPDCNVPDATPNGEMVSREDVAVQTEIPPPFEPEKYETLLKRIADVHEAFHGFLEFPSKSPDRCPGDLALFRLNDIEVCLQVTSNKVSMLNEEMEHLKKRNDELRSKNYKAMDLLRETENRFVEWAEDYKEKCECDKLENEKRVAEQVRSVFGEPFSDEENLTKLLNRVKKEYDGELEKQSALNFRNLNCLYEREILLDDLSIFLSKLGQRLLARSA